MAEFPLAIVLGNSDLLRPLARAGIPCAIAGPRNSPLRHSRYARHVLEWEDDGPIPGQEERVIELAQAQRVTPCLFYQSDHQLLWVSRNRDRLRRVARFVIAERTLVEDLVDKDRFRSFAERHGLPVPHTSLLLPGDDYAIPAGAPMPAVLKPVLRSMDDRWAGLAAGQKAMTIRSRTELDTLRDALRAYGKPLLLQQAVPGPERRIESHHVYVDDLGRLLADFTGRKVRTMPAENGLTTSVEVVHIPDVRDLGREIVRRIGLTGAAKLDFKRSPTGELFLLEINPRFTLWNHPGASAGINIPAMVYADLAGLPRPQIRQPPYRAFWINMHDFAAARPDIGVREWIRWIIRTRPTSALALDDLRPALDLLLRRR